MSRTVRFLHGGWQLIETPPGALRDPSGLPAPGPAWRNAVVPGTVAQSLGLSLGDTRNLDAGDWWYRGHFDFQAPPAGGPGLAHRLRFDGLATLCDAWLNGVHILSARDMFVPQTCVVTSLLKSANELVLRFSSLDTELAARRPRPRWRTALVDKQNLRWVRTTLLGRIPGWSPALAPVGPWKPIALESFVAAWVDDLDLHTGAEGGVARIQVAGKVTGERAQSAVLKLGGADFALQVDENGFAGTFDLPEVPLWWPHTHGDPRLVECAIEVRTASGAFSMDCGLVGFKSVAISREGGKVELSVNGVPVFCRGACWTVDEFLSLVGTEKSMREALGLARQAGLNMIRVGGTMTYETDEFYRACDELGILVWQDFMFANMDYPFADAEFRALVDREVVHQLKRLQKHVSLAVYCGGSEVHQQAAMMGVPSGEWSNAFFDRDLPGQCAKLHPGIPYFASSPCEGSLPFHVGTGISHYYGVGAYRRSVSDVKHAGVKFTSECLGFSNVPDRETTELLVAPGGGAHPAPHHTLWKARVPRDSGAGWDFEDIRDFYTRELFQIDPLALRSVDLERYFEISRVTTGELMKTVFAEWRRRSSLCGGGLVWFFKDLWPGAGWGLVDSLNRPKAALEYLKRAWAPQAVLITDEGLDGLKLHAFNDRAEPLRAVLSLEVYHLGRLRTEQVEVACDVAARGVTEFSGDALIGHFADLTYSYRFGPPKHDIVRAALKSSATGELISEDFYFPLGLNLPIQDAAQVKAGARPAAGGKIALTVLSPCFLQSVHFSAPGFAAAENYFHLAPGQERTVVFSPLAGEPRPFKAELFALNLRESLTVRAET